MLESWRVSFLTMKTQKQTKIKVTPIIELNQIFQLEGSFFYIHKSTVKPYNANYDYTKYYIKKVVDKEQINKMKEILNIK